MGGATNGSKNPNTFRDRVWRQYKRDANRRGKVFELTKEEVGELNSQPCHYCGCRESNCCEQQYKYNGIDRVDNTLGYVKSNVVPACNICNRAKGSLTEKEYMQWLKAAKINLSER